MLRDGALTIVESQFGKLFGDRRGASPGPFALRTIGLPQEPRSIRLPAAIPYPNGIAAGPDGSLIVGSITQGGLHRRAPDGRWSMLLKPSAHVYAATSLRLDSARGRLWGTSPDFLPGKRAARPHRLFSVDIASGRLHEALTLPDGGFGNDIALTPEGDVLVTDSKHGRLLRRDVARRRWTVLAEGGLLKQIDGIGAAGIARASDGRLIVGNFGAGKLAILEGGKARQIELPRLLDNPDGLALAPDGSLIVLEAALKSGNGKILRIPAPFAQGRRAIEILATRLDSPVNLSLTGDGKAYVTESRIRHRLTGAQAANAPPTFRIIEMALGN